MGSSSMPGGSTPVSSANMMSGQFVDKLPLKKKKKSRSRLFFLVLVPVCDLVCGLPLFCNDYLINILTHVSLSTRCQDTFDTWYTLVIQP